MFERLRNAFKHSVLEASKLVSTKTLLLKHYYRRQGVWFARATPEKGSQTAVSSLSTLERFLERGVYRRRRGLGTWAGGVSVRRCGDSKSC